MQRHGPRHFIAYMITAVAYLFIVLFVYYAQSHYIVSSKKPKESVIKMSLSEFVPEVVTPPEPMIAKVEEPVEEKPVEEPEIEPEPVIEKEVLKETVPEPAVEKVTPKVVKKPAKKKLIKKKVQKNRKTKKKKTKKKKTSQRQVSKQQNHSSQVERNKFWNALRKKIDQHKFYPRIAKRRGMEGVAKVTFTILANGNVGSITVKGPKVFHNSAKNAVKNAFPISVKKAPIALPTSINITLHYQIR